MSVQERIEEKEAQERRERKLKEEKAKEKAEKAERARELKEKMKDPEFRKARKAEMKHLREERKSIRKELRGKGIKNYADFHFFAEELHLGYPEDTKEAKVSDIRATISAYLNYLKNKINPLLLLLLFLAELVLIFLFAYLSEVKGRFTINLTADMMRSGFELCESPDFDDTKTRLFAAEIQNSNATSVYEMSRGLAEADGSHNGPAYLAYTFYIRNGGVEPTSYGYTVNILSETLNTASAAWVMFFEDGHQIMYAEKTPDGDPENLWGYPEPPFYDSAYDPGAQYYQDEGRWGIVTTPFIDEYTALQGFVTDMEPGAVKKYTVVVWLEGDDPDCTNSIMGGHVSFNVQFDRLGDEETSYFKGLFRQEYDKTYWGSEAPDQHHTQEYQEAHIPEAGRKAETEETAP